MIRAIVETVLLVGMLPVVFLVSLWLLVTWEA